jgi:hypothetical protein
MIVRFPRYPNFRAGYVSLGNQIFFLKMTFQCHSCSVSASFRQVLIYPNGDSGQSTQYKKFCADTVKTRLNTYNYKQLNTFPSNFLAIFSLYLTTRVRDLAQGVSKLANVFDWLALNN